MSLIGRVVSQIGTAAMAHGRPRDARARTSGQPPIAGIPNPEFGSMSNMRTRSPWGFRKPLRRMVRDGMAIHRRPRSLDRKGAATSGRVSWPLHRDAAGHARGGRAARRSECSPGSHRRPRRLAETPGLRAAWPPARGGRISSARRGARRADCGDIPEATAWTKLGGFFTAPKKAGLVLRADHKRAGPRARRRRPPRSPSGLPYRTSACRSRRSRSASG